MRSNAFFLVVEEATAPELRDPNSWLPQLIPVTALLVVVPCIAGAAGNMYVVGRLNAREILR
ncbi:hypothetical protein CH294_06155 [Rhodococcus sp. 14-2483-1-1]|uniref:hypothetical protein n=1 Tax=Rhodococcus sp. 14-2483-1-1 TaxID=2023148 RepID=UPI000B9BE7D6|nr:hypothetical protein [Rhodococcus sp. 14-2483-1-1]OZF39802.1 hypothetical protein CH294_06155 [Rhodococcus sp. 14-2483-1-1]